jgi:hypothetical protein
MCARNWPEGDNQGHQRRTRGHGICERSYRYVTACQPDAHNARPDNRHGEKSGPKELSPNSAVKVTSHLLILFGTENLA